MGGESYLARGGDFSARKRTCGCVPRMTGKAIAAPTFGTDARAARFVPEDNSFARNQRASRSHENFAPFARLD